METENESPFIKGFTESEILRPSVAYFQACKSYPCRISELIFGGLLVSYILGFVTVGASQLDPSKVGWDRVASEGLIYISISCSFCFLTAALYSVYHHSILTMPNVPISDLTTDFLIAISQAILFGISIIAPRTFLVCLGILLLLVAWRQEVKFRALGKFLYMKLKVEFGSTQKPDQNLRDPLQKREKFRQVFRAKLKEADLFDGWGSLKPTHYFSAILAVGGGIVVWCMIGLLPMTEEQVKELGRWGAFCKLLGVHQSWICAIIYLLVGVFIFWQTRRVLAAKSVALDDHGRETIKKMDEKASVLCGKIKAG